jgi:hypothetical protein
VPGARYGVAETVGEGVIRRAQRISGPRSNLLRISIFLTSRCGPRVHKRSNEVRPNGSRSDRRRVQCQGRRWRWFRDGLEFDTWHPGDVLRSAKRRHFRGLAAKSLVSGGEFWESRTKSRKSRGKSLLDDFSISEIWSGADADREKRLVGSICWGNRRGGRRHLRVVWWRALQGDGLWAIDPPFK